MKRESRVKIFVILLAIITSCLGITGCSSGDVTPTRSVLGNKYIDLVTIYKDTADDTSVLYDKNTNVMYFMVRSYYKCAITPIYNSDGTVKLYDGETKELQKDSDENVDEYVDSVTGVHYLLYSSGAYGETSGITPRLNPDGSIMIDK